MLGPNCDNITLPGCFPGVTTVGMTKKPQTLLPQFDEPDIKSFGLFLTILYLQAQRDIKMSLSLITFINTFHRLKSIFKHSCNKLVGMP